MDLSIKKICDFLKKLGFQLQISRMPYSQQGTYKIVDVTDKKVIFIGNYKSFLKFLASLTIFYERILMQTIKEELKKEKVKGGAS
jgi:hypothetical protein